MKVKELIEELQKLVHQDTDVTISVNEGCHGSEGNYDITMIDEHAPCKYIPDGAAFIEIEKGCMCCGSSKTGKYTTKSINVDHYWVGVEDAIKETQDCIKSNRDSLNRIQPKDLKDYTEAEHYKGRISGMETVERMLYKRLNKRVKDENKNKISE